MASIPAAEYRNTLDSEQRERTTGSKWQLEPGQGRSALADQHQHSSHRESARSFARSARRHGPQASIDREPVEGPTLRRQLDTARSRARHQHSGGRHDTSRRHRNRTP